MNKYDEAIEYWKEERALATESATFEKYVMMCDIAITALETVRDMEKKGGGL